MATRTYKLTWRERIVLGQRFSGHAPRGWRDREAMIELDDEAPQDAEALVLALRAPAADMFTAARLERVEG